MSPAKAVVVGVGAEDGLGARALGSQLADHGPSFRSALRPLAVKAGKRFNAVCSHPVGGSVLPCRGQVAPQCALATVSNESGVLSTRPR